VIFKAFLGTFALEWLQKRDNMLVFHLTGTVHLWFTDVIFVSYKVQTDAGIVHYIYLVNMFCDHLRFIVGFYNQGYLLICEESGEFFFQGSK